jgi:hypothetical protein
MGWVGSGGKPPGRKWAPGESGNPKGRPVGDRNKLATQFFTDLYADWLEHGAAAIQQMREVHPTAYVRTVASVLPRELHVKAASIVEGWTEDEIKRALERIRATITGTGTEPPALEAPGAEGPDQLH